MPAETRKQNKNTHPGLVDVSPKRKRRTSQQVQASREQKEFELAAQETTAAVTRVRVAELKAKILHLQEENARLANHSLSASTLAAAGSQQKPASINPKSVSTSDNAKTLLTNKESQDLDGAGGDTEVDDASRQTAPKPRKKVARVTRSDIEQEKLNLLSQKALQVLEDVKQLKANGVEGRGRSGKRKAIGDAVQE